MIQWKPGDKVIIHYAKKKLSSVTISQDEAGIVLCAARLSGPKGAPKNVGVNLINRLVCVPYGNIRRPV